MKIGKQRYHYCGEVIFFFDTTNFTQQSTENCSFWTKVADAAMMNQRDKR